MYDEIVEIAQNRQFIGALKAGYSYGPNVLLLKSLPKYSSLHDYEEELKELNLLNFSRVFDQPLGYFLIKCFLVSDMCVDKAVFVRDVEIFKKLTDARARKRVAQLLYDTFCKDISISNKNRLPGRSIFGDDSIVSQKLKTKNDNNTEKDDKTEINNDNNNNNNSKIISENVYSIPKDIKLQGYNAIGVTNNKYLSKIGEKLVNSDIIDTTIFDPIVNEILHSLELDVFPRFLKSNLYKLFIQCKALEKQQITINDFDTLRVLGRGAFGFVNACIKKDSGSLYAMKCINKRRVMATDSVKTIMAERNFLSQMNSKFVTGLKYAVMDHETLYLILDLMVGGDLKFHLNKEGRFDSRRARFYTAQILLGLEHIHGLGIIYRDIKLENVLLDAKGHCKISDLGLAINNDQVVQGYAGTPGYTAPEVCLQQPYYCGADFFSLGVMLYRFLSGKKPFQSKRDKKKDKRRGGNELDKNVVEIEPIFPDHFFSPNAKSLIKGLLIKNFKLRLGFNGIIQIKQHVWFDNIDFGLLEAGYLEPPFIPNQDEINADSLRHIGRPPHDDKYNKVKITPEFEKSLSIFPFKSKKGIQKEIVQVLHKIYTEYNFDKFCKQPPNINISQALSIDVLPPVPMRLKEKSFNITTNTTINHTTNNINNEHNTNNNDSNGGNNVDNSTNNTKTINKKDIDTNTHHSTTNESGNISITDSQNNKEKCVIL